MINFDFPSCSEDYVHRIGRTARSDRTGTSYTFFTTGNAKQAKDLISVLKEANQHVNPKLMALAEQAKGMFGRSKYKCDSHHHSIRMFFPLIVLISKPTKLHK